MSILFRIVRDNRDFFCTADDGARFYVGRRVPYESNIGLYNIFGRSPLKKLNYDSSNYQAEFGFWAEFIDPTAECEGRNFLTLNTYDRAAFTFGFTQFAAHVPDGDFVKYFRVLLGRPEAADYFPTLKVIAGRVNKIDGPSPIVLETATTTQPLMNYLNPTLDEVEDSEVIAAAKLIHWTTEHRPVRLAQIEEMIDTYRGFMRSADTRRLIDGKTADQCCVIADVLHHGRGGRIAWTLISDALSSSRPFDNLIAIGAPRWNERKATLKRRIQANPKMKSLKWSSAAGDFV
ncbi:MAG TPA: hypothetical protein VF067_02465 [Sphingomicrobium sp.]